MGTETDGDRDSFREETMLFYTELTEYLYCTLLSGLLDLSNTTTQVYVTNYQSIAEIGP
jgi:hypothetical protein